MKKTIIIPIPNHDFDPTEVSVPWQVITDAGHHVEFATIDGNRGYADPVMLTGEGLDPWGWITGLKKFKLIGLSLRANHNARVAYRELEKNSNFLNPRTYDELRHQDYDGLILPGGHAQRMKPYLENENLQKFVATFFETLDVAGQHKPVAAICHGVLVAARAISDTTGKSVLYGKKTTCLPWKMEKTAWDLTKYFARFWDAEYYRTYKENKDEPPGYRSVEHEVTRALKDKADFLDVPKNAEHYFSKTSGLKRDSLTNSRPAWTVRDGNYLSARWPGDSFTFAQEFVSLLK